MPAAATPFRKAAWVCLILLLAAAIYEFAPDGSTDAGVPETASRPVRKAIARLRSRRASRRCEAAQTLAHMYAPAAVPYLIALLDDEQDAMGPVEHLVQNFWILGDRSRPVWSCASYALGQIGPDATPALVQAFGSPKPPVRMRAMQILALSRDPEAARFLSTHLEDPDPFVRQQALVAVAQSRLPGREWAIRGAFHDPDPQVRALAVNYAAPEFGAWAYDAVLRAKQDPDAWVRQRAADRLRSWQPGALR